MTQPLIFLLKMNFLYDIDSGFIFIFYSLDIVCKFDSIFELGCGFTKLKSFGTLRISSGGLYRAIILPLPLSPSCVCFFKIVFSVHGLGVLLSNRKAIADY